ncbi:MAG TPA: amino acid deaminase/aldolase [Streptosporangiaceae bacterium]|nr:amino acid deaminase/aldolase [Streptosporangiaceae bacterium]
MSRSGSLQDLRRLDSATAHLDAPFAIVDMAAFQANAAAMTRRARGKPIRLASKSVRCRHLIEHVLQLDGFRGILAYTLPEALWLAACGTSDDIVVAYPTTDRSALGRLAGDATAAASIAVMVDCTEHLDLIEKVAGEQPNPHPVRVAIDIDAGYVALGGRFRAGARRSPVRTPGDAVELAKAIMARPGLRLVGLMAYEGQIAGVGDNPPGRPLYGAGVRLMQRRSAAELAVRRSAIVTGIRALTPLEFVNGGGTGSLEGTSAEPAVTEIGAGSGLYHPTLFDAYRGFTGQPAAMFALPVVRRPGPGVVTALGGGYPASGPGAPSRVPSPYLPGGLRLDREEGAGEVQTPLLGPAAASLRIGDKVWMRHAKAGELCERFSELHLVDGESVVAAVPTYRGEGQTFL